VVDGYGWPIQGIFDLGWHEKTKYRVDPGFYNAEVSVLVHLDAWKKLDPARKDLLSRNAIWLESLALENPAINAREAKRQADAGIEAIAFPGAVGQQYLAKAYEVGWAAIIAQSPEHGPKLKQLLSK
jgi:hypothetical protein